MLKKMPPFRDLPLEQGRQGFLRWITQESPQGSSNNQVTVVFDGNPDYFGAVVSGDIRVIFSDGCTADDKIKSMVEDDADKKNCVVVSDDKEVFLYARSLGARVMSVAAFTSRSKHEDKRQKQESKHIPLSRQEKINKELERIWLKEE